MKSKTTKIPDRNLIASLAHGLTVLEAVAAHHEPIPLATLAETVKMKKTSTWRLVHTLVRLGYVRQDPKTRTFRPAPRVLSLGYGYFDGLDLKQLSGPFLQHLSAQFNETVNLSVRDGDDLVYIERIRTSQIININMNVGSRLPLYRTSMGRALICEMPDEWLKEYIGRLREDPKAKDYIKNDEKGLLRRLEEPRRLGYSLNDEEVAKGLRSIGAPIRGASSEIVAAANVSVPSSRATVSELRRKFAPSLILTAQNISMALGYRNRK